VQIFGAKDYAMRIWLKPDRLAQLKMTRATSSAPSTSRTRSSPPARSARRRSPKARTSSTRSRRRDASRRRRVREDHRPRQSRRLDSALVGCRARRARLEGLRLHRRINGKSATLVGIFLQPGANALEVAKTVRTTMAELKTRFPEGLTYAIPYDTTRFVEVSIREVLFTLGEAMVLVFLVVYLFLQSWRATIIPLVACPVSLLGAFAGLYLLNYSINTLTLFGMVLAIGIVVDDAIVVLENVERIMREDVPSRAKRRSRPCTR
jgi:multidrug efflux pump subunit AcrB